MKTYKEFKKLVNQYTNENSRNTIRLFHYYLKIEVWPSFKDSAFVKHISFLWHWKNFFFLLKYPFWKSRNVWTGEFSGYAYTWYDCIEIGWRKAFGKQLSDEIRAAGKAYLKTHPKARWKDILQFQQIKEKWGSLCIAGPYSSSIEEIEKILEKYEHKSYGYCIHCGKPARYMTRLGWVSFMCKDCFIQGMKYYYNQSDEQIEKLLVEDRLTKEDIPTSSKYEYETILTETFNTEEEMKKRFDELWDDENKPLDIHFRQTKNEDGTFSVQHIKSTEHVVNWKEEYDTDLEELWDIK